MKLFSKLFIFLAIIALLNPDLQAQGKKDRFKEKKYIFLLDITKSLFGCCGAEDIFDDVRDHLMKAINNIPDEKTEIVLSTYQEQIIDTWKVMATPEGKKKLISNLKDINNGIVPGQNTNLYGAWIEAKKHLDKDKINIVFILTDGEHNDNNVPIQKLYNEIPNWEQISNQQQAYMFFVELAQLDIDEKVRKLVIDTKDAQIIHGIEFFVLEIRETNPVLNIEEELSLKLDLAKDNWDTKYDNLPITLSINDPHFRLERSNYTIKELPADIKLIMNNPLDEIKKERDETSNVLLQLDYPVQDYPQIKILDSKIEIQINNRKERVLRIEVVD